MDEIERVREELDAALKEIERLRAAMKALHTSAKPSADREHAMIRIADWATFVREGQLERDEPIAWDDMR